MCESSSGVDVDFLKFVVALTHKKMQLLGGHDFILGYCTDVEGNLDFWHKYVDISPVLYGLLGCVICI